MSEMTKERANVIGAHIKSLVPIVNSITVDDIEAILDALSREEAIGPLLDPTGFQFEQSRGTRKVMQAFLDFKKEVSGIGDFK